MASSTNMTMTKKIPWGIQTRVVHVELLSLEDENRNSRREINFSRIGALRIPSKVQTMVEYSQGSFL